MDFQLYISDRLADLNDDSLILFNYTAEELESPAVVKNSYSQNVTLPATPANNAIFGNIYGLDRVTLTQPGQDTGVYFDATKKIAFQLFRNGELIESGYLKLNNINLQNGRPTGYVIQLFGGLGSFFYLLSYDDSGNKLTLADLDWRGTLDPDSELDFTIDKTAVRAAWTYIKTADGTGHDLWDVLNFVPCYNGIPAKDFDADKAIFQPAGAGLPTSDSGYITQGGYSLVNLPTKYEEWAVKDLRSYMQRPAWSVRSFFYALQNYATDNGYILNLDASFFNASNPYYQRAWVTLPLLNTLSMDEDAGSWTQALATATYTDYDYYQIITPGQTPPAGAEVIAHVEFTPRMQTTQPGTDHYLGLYSPSPVEKATEKAILYQLVAYDSINNVIAGSEVVAAYSNVQSPRTTAQIMATAVYKDIGGSLHSYTALGNGQPGATVEGHFTGAGAVQEWTGGTVSLALSASNVDHYEIRETPVYFNIDLDFDGFNTVYAPGIQWVPDVFSATGESNVTFQTSQDGAEDAVTFTWSSPAAVHTGKVITKQDLFTMGTPADYMLSYTKLFGLRYLVDKVSNTITITSRPASFVNNVTDMTPRLDISKAAKITPVTFTARWYEWAVDAVGFWPETYQEIYNREYGGQRVNTGYDFDLSTKAVLSGNVYQGAATVQEKSKYYINVVRNGSRYPSVFVDPGATYSLYSGTDSKQMEIPVITWAYSVQPLDAQNILYDPVYKLQLHGKDNAAIDGSGVLCFFQGTDTQGFYSEYNLTDDTSIMLTLNANKPCWILNPTTEDSQNVGAIYPIFTRDWIARTYGVLNTYSQAITLSFEFAQPLEMALPFITADPTGYVYPQYWQKYIADRYDRDSHQLKASVILDGLQVDEKLLQGFYWYDNALWALNKISNYSLTKNAPTDVELIRVKDKNNYLT